jgi:hypothetical protein
MTVPGWPASLRQTPRRNTWTGGPLDFRRRFTPDRGDDIVRRSTTAEVMAFDNVVFPNLSGAQRATFEAFYADDLQGGTLPFAWHDPVTGQAWLWRINGDGRLGYSFTSKGADNHDLTLSLVRRPALPWWSPYLAPRYSTLPALVLDFANQRYGVNGELRGIDTLLTFTRASTGARVTAAGLVESMASGILRLDHDPLTGQPLGLLMEEARTNLLLVSQAFDNANWTKAACTVTANTATSPNGTADADRFIPNLGAAAGTAGVFQIVTFGATAALSASVWVKSGTLRARFSVQARNGATTVIGSASGDVSLDGATLSSVTISGFTDAAMRLERYPDGWSRVIFEGVTPAATASVNLLVVNADVGDGTNGPLAWGAQIEAGSFATSYIATSGTTATRAADSAFISGAAYSEWAPSTIGTMFRRVRPRQSLLGSTLAVMSTALSGSAGADSISMRFVQQPAAPTANATVFDNSVLQASTPAISLTLPARDVEAPQVVAWDGDEITFGHAGTLSALTAYLGQPDCDLLTLLSAPGNAHLSQLVIFGERIPDEFLSGMIA